MKTLLPLFCLAALLANSAHAELRTWTNLAGDTVEAELVNIISDELIQIEVAHNRRRFDLRLDQLSEADRTYVAQQKQARAEAERAARLQTRRARWGEDFEAGMEDAQAWELPVFLLFTGSEWCPPCQALEDEVLSENAFENLADRRLVLVKADRPPSGWRGRWGDEHAALASRFDVSSFPTVILLDPQGNELERFRGYSRGTAEDYLARLVQALGD